MCFAVKAADSRKAVDALTKRWVSPVLLVLFCDVLLSLSVLLPAGRWGHQGL